ncbi:hypothetical protein [Roseobacter phage RDJL6]|nr:hypothetical protein [Roseobacter phage RDJL6]
MTPTGRKPSQPEPQPIKQRDLEKLRSYCLADVDYSQVEKRVIASMGARSHGKSIAWLAQLKAAEADIARAFGVPTEELGEDRGPLTGEELRAIMDDAPDWARDLEVQPAGWQQPSTIKRFRK